MEFNYSICYPDKDEIDFIDSPIRSDEVLRLVKEFDWDSELEKEIYNYAPDLDFIKLLDKNRIIFSGIGDGKLGSFQVMYIIPNSNSFENVFDERRYKNTDSYASEVSIEKGNELLRNFINGDYHKITSVLKKDQTLKDIQKVRSGELIIGGPHSAVAYSKEDDQISKIEVVFVRIVGVLLCAIFYILAQGFYNFTNSFTKWVYIFGGLLFIFLGAMLYFEFKLFKKK